MPTYRIVRMYRDKEYNRVMARHLSLEEAQSHCKDPNTSSRHATSPIAQAHTDKYGPWFDGYEEE